MRVRLGCLLRGRQAERVDLQSCRLIRILASVGDAGSGAQDPILSAQVWGDRGAGQLSSEFGERPPGTRGPVHELISSDGISARAAEAGWVRAHRLAAAAEAVP